MAKNLFQGDFCRLLGVDRYFVDLGMDFVELAHAIVREQEVGYRFVCDGRKNGDLAVGSSVVVGYMECGGKFGDRVEAGCSNVKGPWI